MDSPLRLRVRDKYPVLGLRLTALLPITLALLLLALVANDFIFFSDTWGRYPITFFRVLVLGALVFVSVTAIRNGDVRFYELAIVIGSLGTIGMDLLFQWTRPPDYPMTFVVTIGIIVFHLLVLPAPLPVRIFAPVFATAHDLAVLFFYKTMPAGGKLALTGLIVSVLVVGLATLFMMRRLDAVEADAILEEKEHNQLKESLAEVSSDAILLVRDGLILDCNRRFLELSGWPSDGVRGRAVEDILQPKSETSPARLRRPASILQVELREREIVLETEVLMGLTIHPLEESGPAVESISDLYKRLDALNLSHREKDICRGILEGKSRFEIGREHFISPETVKSHTSNIYGKLGIAGKMDLVRLLLV